MTSDYRPIDCDLHSEFELLAMHGEMVDITATGEHEAVRGRVVDVITRAGEEFLVVLGVDGVRHAWRLDRLASVRRVRDGRVW